MGYQEVGKLINCGNSQREREKEPRYTEQIMAESIMNLGKPSDLFKKLWKFKNKKFKSANPKAHCNQQSKITENL